jgi:hypothetical protein
MEYKVVRNKDLRDFEKEVKGYLDKGYNLYGDLVIDTVVIPKLVVTIFHQVLIKEDIKKGTINRKVI